MHRDVLVALQLSRDDRGIRIVPVTAEPGPFLAGVGVAVPAPMHAGIVLADIEALDAVAERPLMP